MYRSLFVLLLFGAVRLGALTSDELTLLQDPGGWEYISITDADNGFETQHVCFDKDSPGKCQGNMLFRADNTFKKSVKVHGTDIDRGGTYQVDGNSILFFDEFNNKDGPYTAQIDTQGKTLVLEMVQAGVHFKMELLLEKEFRRRLEDKKKHPPAHQSPQ